MEPPTEVVFLGVTYKRNPDAEQRANRVYYAAPRGNPIGSLHRAIYRHHHGEIPDGFLIHHQDGDPFNNDPSNLSALTRKEHGAEHPGPSSPEHLAHLEAIRPMASEWHRSEEGRAWHRTHAREQWDNVHAVKVDWSCEWCGGEIVTTMPGKHQRFCSRKCSREQLDSEHRYKVQVECPICGVGFWQDKYRPEPRTCGRKCGAVLRKRSR